MGLLLLSRLLEACNLFYCCQGLKLKKFPKIRWAPNEESRRSSPQPLWPPPPIFILWRRRHGQSEQGSTCDKRTILCRAIELAGLHGKNSRGPHARRMQEIDKPFLYEFLCRNPALGNLIVWLLNFSLGKPQPVIPLSNYWESSITVNTIPVTQN